MDAVAPHVSQTPVAPAEQTAWECDWCKMVVTASAADFVPPARYAGQCSRNPDTQAKFHWWHRPTDQP